MAERIARQSNIDETCVAPVWSPNVDIPLLELSFACNMPNQPVILLPELRFKSLLMRLIECLDSTGKLMIVDDSNTRFEIFRRCSQDTRLNLYFSAQEVSALNYASDIFHFAITEIGLSTLLRADVVFSSYRRVLRPGSYMIFSAPLDGSFPAFFDILEECLFRFSPEKCPEIIKELRSSMTVDAITRSVETSGLKLTGSDEISFDLKFSSVEQLLFSTLIESHYLGYCLKLSEPDIDSRALLTQLVRSFHHYFQDEKLKVPMKIGLFTTQKPENSQKKDASALSF